MSPSSRFVRFSPETGLEKTPHDINNGIIGRAKRAPHWGVQSRFRMIYKYVGMYVCRGPKSVGGNTWAKRAHAQSQY